MELSTKPAPVALVLVTSAGRLVTLERDGERWLPMLPAGAELVTQVRAACGGEVSGLRVVPLPAHAGPVMVLVARVYGHSPGRWTWAEQGSGAAQVVREMPVREVGFEGEDVRELARLHPPAVRSWLAGAVASRHPLEELLGYRAGRQSVD